MTNMNFVLFLCFLAMASQIEASISGHISTSDIDRLKLSLEKSLSTSTKDDLATIYYSSKGLAFLKIPISANLVKNTCGQIQSVNPNLSLENTFYAVHSWSQLGCSGKIFTKEIIDRVKTVLNDKATTSDIYYAVESLVEMGQTLPDSAKIVRMLQTHLKTDDSLLTFGYTFHTASKLGASGQFAFDRIEDIVVQADEIDGRMLQFEGGLGITSLLLSGIVKLSESLGKTLPLTQLQVEKFANYLLSRRSVQTPKGISSLLEATKAITDSKLSPACISVLGSGVVTSEKTALSVRICDLLGKPLSVSPNDVIAQSATRILDDVVVLSKQKLVPTKDQTLYELDLKHEPGRYKIVLTVGPHNAALSATVLGTVAIQWLEIGVTDTDQFSPGKLQKVQYPNKLSSILEADAQQRLVVRFSLGGRIVHQAFVRLECQKTGREIIFVAEIDNNNVYKFDMDIGSKATELGLKSGKFNVELLIGDAVIANPIRWKLAETELVIGGAGSPSTAASPSSGRGPRPDIQHMFRQPERRPPPLISTFATVAVLAPLLILFVIWFKLGINVSNFRFSLSALLFHGGLGAMFALFFVFWLKLDMFTTSRWLLLFGLITFLAGHRLLSSIAAQKKH